MARVKKETETPTDPLDAMLARLKLGGISDQLDSGRTYRHARRSSCCVSARSRGRTTGASRWP